MRSDKERIIIRSSLAGFVALAIAWTSSVVGSFLFPCSSYSFCIPTFWNRLVPFEHSGIAVTAFTIASLAWIPLNRLGGLTREDQINRAIEEDADPLEMMLKRSKDEGLAVAITMVNEKVYIGQVVHIFNPATPTNNIGLLPLQSGYRDPDTKQMHLTVDYAVTMQKIRNELDCVDARIRELEAQNGNDPELELAKKKFQTLEHTIGMFSLVIPVRQIASAHIFDSAVHAKYFQPTKIVTVSK